MFQVEKILLGPEASAVAGQAAVAADDAVAGEDDRDGVGAVGIGHCPDGPGGSDGGGQLSVGGGLPVGDAGELLPDALLEVGAGQQEGDVEVPALSTEVFVQFPDGPPQDLGRECPALFRDTSIGLPGLAYGGLRYLPAPLELCLEDSPEPLLYPSRMQLLSPVAEAEPVARRTEEHFPTRRLVPDSPYCSGPDEEPVGHPGAAVVLDHYPCLTGHDFVSGFGDGG